MSDLLQLEKTMTDATIFSINKVRDEIVSDFIEKGFDVRKISMARFEKAIKGKLWLTWQNAFAMGYEDVARFGGMVEKEDMAEFADELDVNKWFDWVDDYADLLEKYRDNPNNTKAKEKLQNLYGKLERLKGRVKKEFDINNANYLSSKTEDRSLANKVSDLQALLTNLNDVDNDYKTTFLNVSDTITSAEQLDKIITKQKLEEKQKYKKPLKQTVKKTPTRRTATTYQKQLSVARSVNSENRKINLLKSEIQGLENSTIKQDVRKRLQLQNELRNREDNVKNLTNKLSSLEDDVMSDAIKDDFLTDGLSKESAINKVMKRLQKDTKLNRANSISFLNQTDFGRVYLENRLDYIARSYGRQEVNNIEKRLTENLNAQSSPPIIDNNASGNKRATIIQRFFEDNVSLNYDKQVKVSTDGARELSDRGKTDLPLSNQRYDMTTKQPPNYATKSKNVTNTLFKQIKNAIYPDKVVFQNTARQILADEGRKTNDGFYRLEPDEMRNLGFFYKNRIKAETLRKYSNFDKWNFDGHFANKIERVMVTEIHAAHHLGRLTYYHQNNVRLVKWILDDEKNTVDAPCDRCRYAGEHNSERLAQLLGEDKINYIKPSEWFSRMANKVELSDSLNDIVTFEKKKENAPQPNDNNLSQPPTEKKKSPKQIELSQIKGVYFFDELLTDVNLSIPRHPYCRCRIVQLTNDEMQTIMGAIAEVEGTNAQTYVDASVDGGIGAAAGVSVEELLQAKDTTNENRQWWTGLGKGAAIGAGVLGAGFMMWYFIKTLGKSKTKTAIKQMVEKGTVKADDLVKALEIEKSKTLPIPKTPSKKQVATEVQKQIEKLQEQENRIKLPDLSQIPRTENQPLGYIPSRLPELLKPWKNLEALDENDQLLVDEVSNFLDGLDPLQKTLNVNPSRVVTNVAKDYVNDFLNFIGELTEEQIDGQSEKIKEAQEKAEKIRVKLENTQPIPLTREQKQKIWDDLQRFDSTKTKLTNRRLNNLEQRLADLDKEDLLNTDYTIKPSDRTKLNAKTFKKWRDDLNGASKELEELDQSLSELRSILPNNADGATITSYIDQTIDELADSLNVDGLKGLQRKTERHMELLRKVRELKTKLNANKQRFRYETKTELKADPILGRSATRKEAIEATNDWLQDIKNMSNETLKLSTDKITNKGLEKLIERYKELVVEQPNIVGRNVRKRNAVNQSQLKRNYDKFVAWRNGRLELSPDELKEIRSSFEYLLDLQLKQLIEVEFNRRLDVAEFVRQSMTWREACRIVQKTRPSFSTTPARDDN